jgi:hypothetical protein
MPLLHRRRPLKRWRWVGAFSEDVMLCAAVAHVGPLPVSWWAVWDRDARTLAEHTVRRSGPVRFEGSRMRIEDGPVSADLVIDEVAGVETISPHGAGAPIWTRKQGGVRISGHVTVAGRAHELDAPGIVDDSAGYHARETAWRWSAGVGTAEDGRAVAWNLVSGLHDAPEASERTVWIDGEPHEVAPVEFADGLGSVRFRDGSGELSFSAEATRAHREDLVIFASDYEAPFGTFSGRLPIAGRLRSGMGVMERHSARW